MKRLPRLCAAMLFLAYAGLMATAMCGASAAEDGPLLVQAVTAYFDAEISGDTARIWEMMAPSSRFKKTHSYDQYAEIANRAKVRLKSYDIEKVESLEDNDDRSAMPLVEKLAVVTVNVVLADESGVQWRRSTRFTFLYEGGRWYKG